MEDCKMIAKLSKESSHRISLKQSFQGSNLRMGISTVVDYDLKAIQNQHLKSWIEMREPRRNGAISDSGLSWIIMDYPLLIHLWTLYILFKIFKEVRRFAAKAQHPPHRGSTSVS